MNVEKDFPGVARAGAVSFKIGEYVFIGTGANTSKTVERERFRDFFAVRLDEGESTTDGTQKPVWTVNYTQEGMPFNVAVAPMPNEAPARNGGVGFSINGKGYVGLGYDGTKYLKDFWEYTPETNSWKRVADYPGDSVRFAVSFVIDNIAYVGLGENFDNDYVTDFYKFDGTEWKPMSSYGRQLSQSSAFVVDGKGYVVGGLGQMGASYLMYRYDPKRDIWEQMNKTKDATRDDFDDEYTGLSSYGHTAFVLYPNDIEKARVYLATGGSAPGGQAAWEYYPKYDYWIQRHPFEGNARKFAVSFTLTDKNGVDHGYVTTGGTDDMTITNSGGRFYGDTWMFNPEAPYEHRD